jgi:hypothetical protein
VGSEYSDANIILEILQNAEPNDSQGTWFDLEFFADGQWQPVVPNIQKYRFNRSISAIRIVDNGVGYLPTDMTTMGGGKGSNKKSAGQFGTGMKVSDLSALRRKVQVVRSSRNWRSFPMRKPVTTSAGKSHTLLYQTEFFEDVKPGSIVEYRRPTSGMIDALRNIEDMYLPLDRTFKKRLHQYVPGVGSILNKKTAKDSIMVKGRIYELSTPSEHPYLFAYDLHNCLIQDQNRQNVDKGRVDKNIQQIWDKLNSVPVYEYLINSVFGGVEYEEHGMKGISPRGPFLKAATRTYNFSDWKNGMVFLITPTTKKTTIQTLRSRGYTGIDVGESRFLKETFGRLPGAQEGEELLETIEKKVSFHAQLDSNFNDETWASTACRGVAILDKVDPKARQMLVETEEGRTISYARFLRMPKKPKATCLILRLPKDTVPAPRDSINYAHQPFEDFFASATAAGVNCVAFNGQMEFADPNRKQSNLVEVTRRHWQKSQPSVAEIRLFVTNRRERKELTKLPEHSLSLDPDYRPYEVHEEGEIVRIDDAVLYERGVKAADQYDHWNMLFSYNLPLDVQHGSGNIIKRMVGETNQLAIPVEILKKAKKGEGGRNAEHHLEYNVTPTNHALWVRAFEQVYGDDVVIDDMEHKTEVRKERVTTLQRTSKFATVSPPESLATALVRCGVKTLSKATQAATSREYSPSPVDTGMLHIGAIIDKAIEDNVPKGEETLISLPVNVVKGLFNDYGQRINFDGGYMNPFLVEGDLKLYVDAKLFDDQTFDLERLISVLLKLKLNVYKDYMDPAAYGRFAMRVNLVIASIITPFFIQEFFAKVAESPQKVWKLIQRKIETQSFEYEQMAGQLPNLRKGLFGQNRLLGEGSFISRNVEFIMGGIAAAILLTVGGRSFLASPEGAEVRRAIPENAVTQIFKPTVNTGFSDKANFKPKKNKTTRIGVSVEVKTMSDKEMKHRRDTFQSIPELGWGEYMQEEVRPVYTGKGWSIDGKAPMMPTANPTSVKTITHIQEVNPEKGKENLRNRTGAVIVMDSIRAILPNGDETDDFSTTLLSDGSVDVFMTNPRIVRVRYETASPTSWKDAAKKLTDKDYDSIPAEALGYYTTVPQNIDPSKIRLKSKSFTRFKNLGQLFAWLNTKPPYERWRLWRKVTRGARYTIDGRTEAAHNKFHAGQLPQKDYFEFVFNSKELANPLDADCDGQNTAHALGERYLGLPSRQIGVVTISGIRHQLTETYWPGIGWVEDDTMGKDKYIEGPLATLNERTQSSVSTPENTPSEEEIDDAVWRRNEYVQRGCPEVEPTQ